MNAALVRVAADADVLTDFYRRVLPEGGPYALFNTDTRQALWPASQAELASATRRTSAKPNWFYGTASFDGARRRAQEHVSAKRGVYLDIDAGPEKLAKHGADSVYPTQADALAALVTFSKAAQLAPSMVVSSGAGLHVYYALDRDLPRDEWQPLAVALGNVCKRYGLKVDSACTTDSARLLRPPGALHSNGQRVAVLKNTGKVWAPGELGTRLAALLGDSGEVEGPKRRALIDVNAQLPELESSHTPASALKIAERCGALREVATAQGDVTEPLWRAMLGVVKHTVEGLDIAQEWSRGHPDYNPDETEAKFNGWAGTGPTLCETFGGYSKACDSCEHRGKIKSPIVLGRMDSVEIQALPADQQPEPPPWVQEMNCDAAIVIMGGEVRILLERVPVPLPGGGVGFRPDFAKPAALHQLHADRTVIVNGRTVQASQAWMRHPQRRQYNGATFAPGEPTPGSVLNLYRGFAVEPVAGDVGPWLRLLELLVPVESERRFLLQWIAWKVQNPGEVPGTIPILTGAKGTGKNSLFEPIVRIFGPHGAIFDDPELVVGRFTGHLMTLCFVVLDEAMFAGDPRQNDRIKARVTATSMQYEFKGFTPVTGVNRCAFALITNHAHVWHATLDERRAFVVTVGEAVRGNREFWASYHAWLKGGGAAALLHYLLALDLRGFNPRHAPHTTTLAQQVQLTALRNPAAAWWYSVLSEGVISGRDDGGHSFAVSLTVEEPTSVEKSALRNSFTSSAGRVFVDWPTAARHLRGWVPAGGVRDVRIRDQSSKGGRGLRTVLAPLAALRAAFSAATGVQFADDTGAGESGLGGRGSEGTGE